MKKHGFIGLIVLFLALALVMASCDNGNGENPIPDTKYTVTYNANGQAVTVPAPQKVEAGSTVYVAVLEEYVPASPDAPILSGWNTEADGSGDSYDRGAELVVDKDITLYAQWTAYIARPRENTITLEKINFHASNGNVSYYRTGQVYYPESVIDERPEWGDKYKITYKIKSDRALPYLMVSLGDATRASKMKFASGNNKWLELAYPIDGEQWDEIQSKNIEANVEFSYTITATVISPRVIESNIDEGNRTGVINGVLFSLGQAEDITATLTILDLKIEKIGSAEKVELVNVTTNGSIGTKTTEVTLFFDKPVDLVENDGFDIKYDPLNKPEGDIFYIVPGSFRKNNSTSYTYIVDLQSDISSPTVEVIVSMYKAGFSGTKRVNFYTEKRPEVMPTQSRFVSLTADGDSNKTTTKLILTFTDKIPDFDADDIVISGIPRSVGTLSNATESGNNWVYTLSISSFTRSGTLRVYVTTKNDWIITDPIKTVEIYYYRAPQPPVNYPPYSGFIGRGYNVLDKPYYVESEVPIGYALNMPKLVYENKLYTDDYSEYTTDFFTGSTMSEYAKSFASKMDLGVNGGYFKASVSFGYSTSNKAKYSSSFAKSATNIITEKHYLELMEPITLSRNYLNEVFKNDWLMNESKTPNMVFENFGTHIFLVAYIGGRLDMNFEIENTEKVNSKTIEGKVSAAYLTVEGSASATERVKGREVFEKSHLEIRGYGGDYRGSGFPTLEGYAPSYQRWMNNVYGHKSLSLVRGGKLSRKTEMIPIWDLIDPESDPGDARRKAFINAFNTKLVQNENDIMGLQENLVPLNIANVYMGTGKTEELAKSNLLNEPKYPETLKTLNTVPGDLNHGAGGSKLYLGFTQTASDTESPVTDIKATSGTNPNARSTITINEIEYTHFGYDANKDAGGPYIFLYYTKDPRKSPLKNIYVEHNGDSTAKDKDGVPKMPGTGWERVIWNNGGEADMNKGAKGSTVYIWVQR
jgi:hypothetical protein